MSRYQYTVRGKVLSGETFEEEVPANNEDEARDGFLECYPAIDFEEVEVVAEVPMDDVMEDRREV